jgi:hypothetical protein
MARCLISFSEATVALIVTLRNSPDESLESVACRGLSALATSRGSIPPPAVAPTPTPADGAASDSTWINVDKIPSVIARALFRKNVGCTGPAPVAQYVTMLRFVPSSSHEFVKAGRLWQRCGNNCAGFDGPEIARW